MATLTIPSTVSSSNWQIDTPGNNTGNNFDDNETLVITINTPPNTGWIVQTAFTTNVTTSATSGSNGGTLTCTPVSTGAWDIRLYSTFTNQDGTTFDYFVNVSGTINSGGPADSAPVASGVSVDDPSSATYTATFTLTSTGQGGTLQTAIEKDDSTPDNWANASGLSHTANFTRTATPGTIYARARQLNTGSGTLTSSIVSVAGRGFLDPDTSVTLNNDTVTNAATSHTANIEDGSSNTVYQVRTVGYTGTILTTDTGGGSFTVNDVPADDSSKTYYVTAYRTTATGGAGSGTVSNVGTYTVTATDVRTFSISFSYIPGEPGLAPQIIQDGSVTVSPGSTTGSLGSSSNPLEVSVGDTVRFRTSNTSGADSDPTISVLNIFTDNADIDLPQSGAYTDRVVGNGENVTDTFSFSVSDAYGSSSRNQYFERVGGITAPSGISVASDNAAAASVTATVSLTSNGSGGTLEYLQRDNGTLSADGWQTSNTFSQARNTTKYYWASRNRNNDSLASQAGTALSVGYIAPDTAITISGTAVNATITPGATGDLTLTIADGAANTQYRCLVTDTDTPLAANSSVGSRTGNGNITISSGEQPDVQGTTASYKLQARVTTANGGNNSYTDTGNTFTIARQAISAPTDIVFGTSSTAAADVSITATASGGANGTIQLSETSNFATTVADGSSFTFTRGTAKTIYARRIDGAVTSGTYSESNTVGYLAPDTAVAATSSQIAFDAGSATTTISNVARTTEQMQVRLNDGSTDLGTRSGNGDVTFTASLPSVGNTTTYEIFAARTVATGGDGLYDATDDTFTVERLVEPVTAPTDIAFSDPGTNDDNVNITCTASGGSGGTLQVSVDNSNWVANGTAFAFVRGTAKTIYARRLGSGSVTSSYSEAYTPPYRSPDAAITISGTAVNATITPGATGDLTLTIANGGSLDQYRCLVTDTDTPLAANSSVGSRTGNGNITISSGEQPDVQGTEASYKVQVRRPTASGGNNTYADTGNTFTITRQAISTPTDIAFGADPGTAAATVSITATASGGANGTLQVSADNSNWDANGTSYTFTRGTAKTIYARRIDGAVVSSSYSEANTVGYLAADLAVAATSSQITFDASSATTTISNVARSTENIAVRVNDGSTNLGTRNGNGDITFTSSLPAVNNTTTYEIFVARPTSTGGSGSYSGSDDTFTVERLSESVTAPTDIAFSDPGTNDDNVTISCTASGGAGGTLQVSEDNSTWVANGSGFAFVRGTQRTIYARRTGSGANSTSYSENYTPGYRLPDTNISVTRAPTSVSPGYTGTASAQVASGTSFDVYRVVTTDTNTPQASGHNVGSRTGNGSINFAANELPDGQGTTAGYKVQARRPVANGGDNGYDDTGDSFTIERRAFTDPTDIAFGTNNTGSATVSITCTASGGAEGTLEVSEDNSTFVANGSSFTFTRGTAKTIYARRLDGSAASGSYSEATTIGYLSADSSITAIGNQTLLNSATSHSITIANGGSTTVYEVRTGSYGGTLVGSRTGNGSITVSDVPADESSKTYYVRCRLPVANGGSNGATNIQTYSVSATDTQSYTITFSYLPGEPGVAPSIISAPSVSVTPGSTTGSITSSTNPLEIAVGSDVTFKVSAIGTVSSPTISALNIYSDNSNISLNTSGTTRTVQNGENENDPFTFSVSDSYGSDSETYYIERVGGIDAPSGLTVAYDDSLCQTVTVSAALASAGSGGTLEYLQTTSITMNATDWQSSNEFTQARNTTRYYRASRNKNVDSFTNPAVSLTIPYRSPDSAITATVTNTTIAANAGNQSVTIASGSSDTRYRLLTTSTGADIGNGASAGTRTGNGAITISATELPNSGNTVNYKLQARVDTANGGNNSYVDCTGTGTTFSITRSAPTSPTSITFAGDPGTSASSVSIAVTAAGGNGDSIRLSEVSNFSSSAANGTAFTFRRGIAKTIYARSVTDGNQSGNTSSSLTLSYLLPDTDFSSVNLNLTSVSPGDTATSVFVNVAGGRNGETLRALTTDTNTPLASGASVGTDVFDASGSARIVVSSGEQPDGTGTTAGYKLQVRRPNSTGGDNGYDDTGDTFTIQRRSMGTPTDLIRLSDNGVTASTITLVTSASGGSEGLLQVSNDGTNWLANGSALSYRRGTTQTKYARRLDGAVASGTYTEDFTTNYIGTDTSLSASNVTIAFDSTSARVTVGNVSQNNSIQQIAVRLNNGGTNLATRTGAGELVITSNLPTVGNTTTYELFSRILNSNGGSGVWTETDDTFTITRSVETVTEPDDIVFSMATTAASSALVTVTASGGSGGTLKVSDDNSTFVANGSTFTQSRGTTATYYARREGSGANSTARQENFTGPYLGPDLSLSANNVNIAFGDSSATVTVGNVARTSEIIAVRLNNGATNLGTRTGNGDITFTSSLPGEGATTTYELFSARDNSTGGDELFDQTNVTFTVTRAFETPGTPTSIAFEGDPGTSASSVSLSARAAGGGSVGTLEVSEDNANWDPNGTEYSFRRGVAKTIYARRNNSGTVGGTFNDSNTLSYLNPDLAVTLTPATQNISSSATSAIITLGASTSGETYAIRVNDGSTNIDTRTNNGNFTINNANLPSIGNTTTYEVFARRPNSTGGDGSTFFQSNVTASVTRSQDATPAQFSFTDNNNANTETEIYDSVQITDITTTVIASVTSGSGKFAVSQSADLPASNAFTTTNKNITNNDYLHVSLTSDDSQGVTKSTTFSVGGVSDNWNVTTNNNPYDHLVTINYTPPLGSDPAILFVGGAGVSSSNRQGLNTGDIVRFSFSFGFQAENETVSISGLNSNTWSSSTGGSIGLSEFIDREWIGGPGATDDITIAGSAGGSRTGYFQTFFLDPDLTVSTPADQTLSAQQASFQVSISNEGSSTNSTITQYRISNSSSFFRTGPGSFTITDVPTFEGVPTTYYLSGRITTANGGDNIFKSISSFVVTRGSDTTVNVPGIDPFGIAIYDHNGNFVTSFTEASSIPREIFRGSVGLSTSNTTTLSTGLPGSLSAGNVVVMARAFEGAGTGDPDPDVSELNVPKTITSKSTITLGRVSTSTSAEVVVVQYKGETITGSTAPDYGARLYNANGDVVVDELASCYAVREIINLAASNVTFFESYGIVNYYRIELGQGDYPSSEGLPIPAIQCNQAVFLTTPKISSVKHPDGSWKFVTGIASLGATKSSFNIAILTENTANTGPSYFGGTPMDYGVQFEDENGNITWDAGWRNAIINNVINANQFTTGCSGNLTYDVTAGSDGVTPGGPFVNGITEIPQNTESTGEVRTINSLNDMDPRNTYLLGGNFVTGLVQYYTADYGPDFDVNEGETSVGGGSHVPAVRVSSTSSVRITMLRYNDGPGYTQSNQKGDRLDTSHHAEGQFILCRIV